MSALLRGLLVVLIAAGFSSESWAQQPALRLFPTAGAAADALVAALKADDVKAAAAMLGPKWRDFVPLGDAKGARDRASFLAAWVEGHKVLIRGDRAIVEVGKTGWTLPLPVVKDGEAWRFDPIAGAYELADRTIGRNEIGAMQTLLAIVDAQRDYAALDPMKTGAPVYARRLMSSPGRKDGLYWPSKPGETASPLGVVVAQSQPDGATPGGHYGYNFRLLYGQGGAAPGGARDYIVNDRMIGGFAAIAWPVRYRVSGVMTFIVGDNSVVYQRDFGAATAERAALMTSFNPDHHWEKADAAP